MLEQAIELAAVVQSGQRIDPRQRVDELIHRGVLDGHGGVADHGPQKGAIFDGVRGTSARGQRHDADTLALGIEQRRGHAGHLTVEPEREEEAGIACHDRRNPAVVRIERGWKVLRDLDGQLELSLRGADPDGDAVAGEEAAQPEAQPIENRGQLHDLVELGHQVD